MADVRIRRLACPAEFEKLLEIQRVVWGHADLDLTPVHQFLIHDRMGAILLGAFVDGALVGYVYSFPAVHRGRLCQHSHHLAVLPGFQGYGLGKRLKWAQRREALKQGVSLITWTYDPMQARNANLNLHTLGVRGRTYLENFYGFTPALCLGPEVPTDRLLVEWPIKAGRVKERAGRKRGSEDAAALPKALERDAAGGDPFPLPCAPRLRLRDRVLLAEVPPDVKALKPRPDLIAAWQAALRAVLTAYFKRGWVADDFIYADRAYYVLRKDRRG
jgi:chorismate synthase